MVARAFVIGDVHGCADELERLLVLLSPKKNDQVVFVGDLVNKGPASAEVVRIARSIGAQAVMGNHDDLVLRAARARKQKSGWEDFSPGVRKVVKSLSDDELRWLRALPLFLRLPEHRAVVVHAGMVPGKRVEDQKRENLLTMRSIRDDGSASRRVDEGAAWGSKWNGRTHAIYGHDAIRGLQRHPRATGLDTGCVYGGRLSALVLPHGEIVSVKARREHSEPSRAVQKALLPKQPRQRGK